tara:strand:+ start:4 stop:1158 length:1155 start_codon:yes stop_codon:yes gene_type:complete
MPGETYGGPYFGNRTILVFDGNGNYLNENILGFTSDADFLGITSATTSYAQISGITFSTNNELRRFMSSRYFADSLNKRNFIQTGKKSPGIRNTLSFASAKTKSKLGATLSPDNAKLSSVDPRSTHFVYLAATSGYFTADHLDEIQIKTTTGLTLQGYFGGSAEGGGTGGLSGGFTFGIYLLGLGRTFGITGATGFVNITAGNSLENMNNGITTTLVANPVIPGTALTPNIARTIVSFDSFKASILQQIPAPISKDVTTTFNDSSTVSYRLTPDLLNNLTEFRNLVEANHKNYATADADFISTVIVKGLSGGTFPLSATGGGGSGASSGTNPFTGFTEASQLDLVFNDAFTRHLITNPNTASNFTKLDPFDTVRELEQTNFLDL